MKESRAVALLLLTAVLWSLGGVLIKLIRWHPLAISATRSLIGALVIAVIFRPRRYKLTGFGLWTAFLYAGTVTCFVAATKLTTAANAILLQFTAPIHVALWGPIFLKEPSRRRDWAAIAAVGVGMVLFFFDQLTLSGFWGNVLALLSGLFFAWLTLLLRRQKNESVMGAMVLGNLLAAAVGLPFVAISPWPDLRSWAALAVLGVFQLGIPYALFTIAVRHVSAMEAILVPVIEPILNPLWVLAVVGEAPGPYAAAGGLLVLGSLAGRGLHIELDRRRRLRVGKAAGIRESEGEGA